MSPSSSTSRRARLDNLLDLICILTVEAFDRGDDARIEALDARYLAVEDALTATA
jgi:hypothetical protein